MHRYAVVSISILIGSTIAAYDAYVVVPVADLVGQPLSSADAYTTIPYSGDSRACRRLHQILYHERVHVIDSYHDQVHVELPNIFYQPTSTKTRQSTFWTLKKYLLPISKIHGDINKLPHLRPYQSWNRLQPDRQPLVTLLDAYYDPVSKLNFSAGTQFVQADQPTEKLSMVYFLDPKTGQIKQLTLPAHLCVDTTAYTPKERIDLFIRLIRSWMNQNASQRSIPYVWGGTSIACTTSKSAKLFRNKSIGSWYDSARKGRSIKTGCDCSGLIVRAAHIAGIPYFFKNSYTATCYLKPIPHGIDALLSEKKQLPLASGDIIWVPGHVMIVADLHKSTLFEARSYDHGYGKLQEIPLEKVFKGIKTYQDLLIAYEKKLPLYRMNSAGIVKDTFKECKLLSLASSWDISY